MSYLKQYGTSAKGNDRLLKSYGGNSGSSPMARQKYASGGAVRSKDGNPSLAEGLSAADGAPAKPSLARPGRKMPGKGGKDAGKKGTTVNIVIAGKSPDAGPKPDMPMAGGPPPPHPMPMPPPGAGPGGPPMPPMRKHGGAVGKYATGGRIANLGKFAHGGKVKRADGGKAGESDVEVRQSATDRAKSARSKALDEGIEAAGRGLTSGVGAVGAVLPYGRGNKLFRAFNAGASALMGTGAKQAYDKMQGAREEAKEADKSAAGEERKFGGRTKSHVSKSDEAEKEDVRGDDHEFAKGGKVCRAEGGPAIGLHEHGKLVGSGGAAGRLAKTKMYGK